MSNILIIKRGSLGDIVQISGVLRDIRENFLQILQKDIKKEKADISEYLKMVLDMVIWHH